MEREHQCGENNSSSSICLGNETETVAASRKMSTEKVDSVEGVTESKDAPTKSSENADNDMDPEHKAASADRSTGNTEQTAPDPAPVACPRDASFTSENFKIEISQLPKQFGFAQLKKRLSVTLGLNPHKLKALPMKSFAFVCFSSEKDRQEALQAINGHVWKGRTLKAKKALPAADPMKRKRDESPENASAKKPKQDDSLPAAVRLRSSVEPLWEIPYEEQLKRKTEVAEEALRAIANHGELRHQFKEARQKNRGMCCAMDPIVPSPVLEGYRNKNEFSIGRNEDDSETVVGFRFGLYKDGTDCVGSPCQVSTVSPQCQVVVQSFQEYVQKSMHPPFNHRTHSGHWRQLTVRTTSNRGGTLAIAEFVLNGISKEMVEREKASLRTHFESEGKMAGLTTLFFRPCSAKTSNSTSEEPYQLVFGDGYIHETLGSLKFRISPSAFFQVNTAAAEQLYNLIADWCCALPTTTILDICCGTGTIGQFMAKKVGKVIGIEMCKEAVEDAKVNATLNGITNVKYYCDKVEAVISKVTRDVGEDTVAILDPPRGGVHPSVIKALRKCYKLNRIVYAACNPAGAKSNFIDLYRPKSRKMRGQPFRMVRAVPLDMFPSTPHFELLVLFERTPCEQNPDSTDSD